MYIIYVPTCAYMYVCFDSYASAPPVMISHVYCKLTVISLFITCKSYCQKLILVPVVLHVPCITHIHISFPQFQKKALLSVALEYGLQSVCTSCANSWISEGVLHVLVTVLQIF